MARKKKVPVPVKLDSRICFGIAYFTSEADATAYAHKIVQSGVTVYGHATVQLERYLPIEGTVHSDWEPIGEPEYIEE